MGLSGSYEHKDIDSNNNNKNIWKGTQGSKNLFDTLRYIVTCMNEDKDEKSYAFNFNDIPALVFFVRWGSAFDTLIALYTTWLNSGFFSQAFAEILHRKFIPVLLTYSILSK